MVIFQLLAPIFLSLSFIAAASGSLYYYIKLGTLRPPSYFWLLMTIIFGSFFLSWIKSDMLALWFLQILLPLSYLLTCIRGLWIYDIKNEMIRAVTGSRAFTFLFIGAAALLLISMLYFTGWSLYNFHFYMNWLRAREGLPSLSIISLFIHPDITNDLWEIYYMGMYRKLLTEGLYQFWIILNMGIIVGVTISIFIIQILVSGTIVEKMPPPPPPRPKLKTKFSVISHL